MSCERWEDAISALVDGEDLAFDHALVHAHLRRCPSCRAYKAFAEGSRPRNRIHAAAVMPDLSRRLARAQAKTDRARDRVVRALLAVVAIGVIATALPALVLGEASDTSEHAARHLGAFSVAYGVCLLVVAVRPARARTVLPAAVVLAAALALTGIVDLGAGRIPLAGEADHLPEMISVVLVWLLTRHRLPADRGTARSTPRELDRPTGVPRPG